jgi:M6 family metalloprotease-like protein
MALSVRPALAAVALLVLGAVRPAGAQVPHARPGQFELPGMDFRPRGAWRQRSANVRAQRQALLNAGNFAMLNSRMPGMAGTVVTGSFFIPVVPILFSNTDTTTVHQVSEYQNLLFSANPVGLPYSVKTYYEQLTHNRIAMSGKVFPWVHVDSSDTYYEDNCNGVGVGGTCPNGGERFAAMLLQALGKVSSGADSATVWAEFDNDGADGVPNSGDDDGVVDFVTFIQPDVDGACGTPHIWAHRYVLDYWNGGSPYVTKTNRAGGGKIVIRDYTIQSGVGGNSACNGNAIMPIGTVTHETGHAFGLPDLYDTDQVTEGVGEWDLMGSGNYTMPYSPSRMGAWSLAELGWTTVDTLKTTGTITLNPVATSDTVRLLRTQTSGEYFLFEDRAAIQSDSAQMNPANPALGTHLKRPGLVVWHIDQSRISAGSFSNSINTGAVQGVAVVQADGLNELRTPYLHDRGDTGDSYPGSANNTALDGYTSPGLLTNAGKVVPGRIDSITVLGNGAVQFRYRMEYGVQVTRFGTGTGTIVASVPGNPLVGLGAPEGSLVTLTARPAAGHKFAGWTGDTTSSDTSIVLTMDRNRSLMAQFTFTAPFTLTAAATDLLGSPALSVAQRTVLDDAGNHNGTYDLGDFLAWVTATAQGVPPALMARLLAAESAPKGVTP